MTSSAPGRKGKVFLTHGEKASFSVEGDKLYVVEPAEKILLQTYDLRGQRLNKVELADIPKIKITPEDKLELMAHFKYVNGLGNQRWQFFKKNFNFYHPEYFPRYQKTTIDQQRLYMMTYEYKKDAVAFLIYDTKGNFKKKRLLPKSRVWAIKNNIYYYLIFSDDEEEWTLNKIILSACPQKP